MLEKRPKQKRGFAMMTLEEKRRIARLGGIAAHKSGNAHEWTREEAQLAGKKGGESLARTRPQSK